MTEEILSALEFDKVLHQLEKICMGPLGKAHVMHLVPMLSPDKIQANLDQVAAFKKMIDEQEVIQMHRYESIKVELDQLRVEGYVLSIDSMMKLRPLFENVHGLIRFFNVKRQSKYPVLAALLVDIESPSQWLNAINQIVGPEGEISPNASSEIRSILKSIQNKRLDVDRVFRKEMMRYKGQGFLSETNESVRNGRRVLSVSAESKRKVNGIVHDESATGKTAFIEPAAIVQINNEIVELELSYKKEVYKLLKGLSEMLHPFVEEIRKMYHLIGLLDFIRAKAMFGAMYEGQVPAIVDQSTFQIQVGRHPLLLLKNRVSGKETVPFDLVLHAPNRLLLLSGPNAGGKSILMKAVGLMQLMVQSGLMVPVDPKSVFGIFHQVFVDIGDQQSIEDELSTYSSHLKNMRLIFEQAKNRSLVLIDEFGSGTDPKLGASIAESMLGALNRKKVAGVITTHYSNLKVFAFKNKGIVNGAMIFDKELMQPTYKLQVGRPGSSFTFEIAERSGFDKKMIKEARNRSGKALQAMEDLITDMEQKQHRLEEKLASIDRKENRLDQLIKNYERMSHELDVRKKRFRLEKKEADFHQISQTNKKMEQLVKELKEKDSLAAAKKKLAEIKTEKKVLQTEVVKLNETVNEAIRKDIDISSIQEGSYVRLQNGTSTGQVQTIDKKDAYVTLGGMTMRVKIKDLVPMNAPIETRASKSIQTQIVQGEKFESKLDIRGMRAEDALHSIQQFLDEALLANALHVQIVHGKGTGVLRSLVKGKLKEYPIVNAYHPEDKNGGEGVTFVEF